MVWSPELAVDREDSDSLGPGRGNDEFVSSYGGGSDVDDNWATPSLRSGSSKVTRLELERIAELFRFRLSVRVRESELR